MVLTIVYSRTIMLIITKDYETYCALKFGNFVIKIYPYIAWLCVGSHHIMKLKKTVQSPSPQNTL